jgi:DNA helicase-2/ATP-dependent DNA helicase PcrA
VAIREVDKAAAEAQQWAAATDENPRVRLAAGPGTGKSKTIEKRVVWALQQGANPQRIYVISFTRATSHELQGRIRRFGEQAGHAEAAAQVRVSTMHSLALTILRQAGLLTEFPTDYPLVLDEWEQEQIHDSEFANYAKVKPARAEEIRIAHDAAWQTLSEDYIAQAKVTVEERRQFDAFHGTRTNLYCCVLPGELVYRCVRAIGNGTLTSERLPQVQHLVVDEFQDLNACDQTFVRLLAETGATLFIAGDDDQSIYLFRHANPQGIVRFPEDYPGSSSHILTHCFRCPPAILDAATALIRHNPNRVEKDLQSLLATAEPAVPGLLQVWSFATAEAEARAVANSCQALLAAGMKGREDTICILVANRGPLLDVLLRELGNLGLPFEAPAGKAITDEDGIRIVYCLLRILRDLRKRKQDYPAHRALLGLLHGVGPATAREVAQLCLENAHNFREIFYTEVLPGWLTGRSRAAVERVRALAQELAGWNLEDTLLDRGDALRDLLERVVGEGGTEHVENWTAVAGGWPAEITLAEIILFLEADSEAEQTHLLDQVRKRAGTRVEAANAEPAPEQKRIRLLTMHGAKGLDGYVVFIPWMEQGVVPSRRALKATGLVMEQRRLFYVALTRAKAVCVVSHAIRHQGPLAFALAGRGRIDLPRSQFLNEMDVASVNREVGLSADEGARFVAEVEKL